MGYRTMLNLIAVGQTILAYTYGDPSEKWDRSRSNFKVTQGHRN